MAEDRHVPDEAIRQFLTKEVEGVLSMSAFTADGRRILPDIRLRPGVTYGEVLSLLGCLRRLLDAAFGEQTVFLDLCHREDPR